MPRSVLRIGTRTSALALAQAESVRQAIQQIITRRNFELVPMPTDGDGLFTSELPPLGRPGLYTDAITEAIADGKIDLGVHSAKDIPVEQIDQVTLAAVPLRMDPRDAILTRRGSGLHTLQPGAKVGASGRRRAAQILAMQRGLVPHVVRGNLDSRLRKLTDGEVDALVVGVAALRRVGKDQRVSEILPFDLMLPAPGQGCLAVECRAGDKDMRAALAQIEDPSSRRVFDTERAFLAACGGDAAPALAALAKLDGPRIRLRAMVASADGATVMRDFQDGEEPETVGETLAARMLDAGATDLLGVAPVAG